MKIFVLFLIGFASAFAFAQPPQKDDLPPGVAVRKCKWERVGPAPSIDSNMKAESDSPTGGSNDPNVPEQASGLRSRDNSFFQYSVEVVNDGSKSIKAILWDYIITDSSNNEELGRHNFVSFDKVGRNSVKALHVRSRLSPSRVVTVQSSPPPGSATVVEKVVLRCVIYDDGTLWQQPGTNENCDALQKRANNRSGDR
ncbi:MAG TPA: hypothetical protein VE863_09260 [Pyrinomonadaceae bacterium]|jgi:hypothetical protein|nr:hypothetical protein [Pyrinomonadaceae bacterium]